MALMPDSSTQIIVLSQMELSRGPLGYGMWGPPSGAHLGEKLAGWENQMLPHCLQMSLLFLDLTSVIIPFLHKESASNAGDFLQCLRPGFDPWVRKNPWRRKWQPTPVFLAGNSYGQRSPAGYSSLGCKSCTRLSD